MVTKHGTFYFFQDAIATFGRSRKRRERTKEKEKINITFTSSYISWKKFREKSISFSQLFYFFNRRKLFFQFLINRFTRSARYTTLTYIHMHLFIESLGFCLKKEKKRKKRKRKEKIRSPRKILQNVPYVRTLLTFSHPRIVWSGNIVVSRHSRA